VQHDTVLLSMTTSFPEIEGSRKLSLPFRGPFAHLPAAGFRIAAKAPARGEQERQANQHDRFDSICRRRTCPIDRASLQRGKTSR